ncbi:MAG: LamG domain-containing protein, partial [Dehalococcoidia bacterium]
EDHWWMLSTRDPSDVGSGYIRMRFRLKTWPEDNTHTLVDNSGEYGALTDNVGGYVNIDSGTWYFVAAVYDGSTMKIYVNGNLYASANVPKVAPFPYDEREVAASSASVWIGDNPETSGNRQFDGIIDEVAIFSRALSPSEITDFYNGGTGKAICNADCPAGLVSYWPFNEGSGTTAADSKNGNDGTIQSGVMWTTGKIGNGLDFPGSGTDGYVDVGIVDVFSNFIDIGTFDIPGSDMTILAWFKADDFGVNDGRIISKATGTDTDDHFWMLSTRGVGGSGAPPYRMRFRVSLGGSTETLIDGSDPSSSSLTDTEPTEVNLLTNTWYFVAAVYDGSTMKIYLNGQLIASASPGGTRDTNTAPVWMGDNPNTGQRPFDGIIDEVALFSRALTQEEIENLYNNGMGRPICEFINVVGGFVAPTNKLEILAPYLTFVGLVVAVTVMATALKKKK